jgi:UDP-glucose 4-epimerase
MKAFVTGCAGFIGYNLVLELIQSGNYDSIIGIDNLSVGDESRIHNLKSKNFNFIKTDVNDIESYVHVLDSNTHVFHLAANSDIASALNNPVIDFYNGTQNTQSILEAMRKSESHRIIFTSGSGVYGEAKGTLHEELGNLMPISTYGASKLSSESLISAYSFLYDIKSTIFRFANVVGPYQTHGVTFEFVLKLLKNSKNLEILGDGRQTKPYVHVSDVFSGLNVVMQKQKNNFEIYNLANKDRLTVNEIADIVCEVMNLESKPSISYTGGNRGWKGDVPNYQLDTTKINNLGWKTEFSSYEEVRSAARSALQENVSLWKV